MDDGTKAPAKSGRTWGMTPAKRMTPAVPGADASADFALDLSNPAKQLMHLASVVVIVVGGGFTTLYEDIRRTRRNTPARQGDGGGADGTRTADEA